MQSHYKRRRMGFVVKLLVIWLTSFVSAQSVGLDGAISISVVEASQAETAAEHGIPTGWESYLERPDIFDVPAKAHQLGDNWERLKAAHFSFVAELLSLYSPDTHLYFLARDSEHLYDVARLVTEGTQDAKRIHLLNVSRANMRDPNIKAYLAQNGISEEAISAGKKVLFVDTGFSGTIPRVIGEIFPAEIRSKLKTHLIVSSNAAYPSSRAFLVHLNPSVNEQNPSSMHGTIVSYEHMPRYTDRSSRFVLAKGVYHPISVVGQSSDGSVSKEKSLNFMEDLRNEWLKPETRARFQSERSDLELVKRHLGDASESTKAELKAELEKSKDNPRGRLLEAYVRDFLEGKRNAELKTEVSLDDFEFKPAQSNASSSQTSKKNELIKKFPEWAPYLEDPDTKIPELFAEKNWQMIGNLIDANVDVEINRLVTKFLFDAPATGIKKSLQVLMIEKGDPMTLQMLAWGTFSLPHAAEMKDLIKLLIEKGDATVLKILPDRTFSKPYAAEMKDLIKLVIEKGDSETLQKLVVATFSQPHAAEMKDLIKLVIEKANGSMLQKFAETVFSQPHAAEMKDLIKLVIEKANDATLESLAWQTFSQPHAAEMKDLIRLVIEKANGSTLRSLALHTFSKPHATAMKDLIRLFIEKADAVTLRILVSHTFSKPHAAEMKDLIKLVIEKGDVETLRILKEYYFRLPGVSTPEHRALQQSLEIANPLKRKEWLDVELARIGSQLSALTPKAHASATKPISPSLQPGDVVNVKNRMLTIVKEAGDGRRGVVYQVRAENGARYALKVAKDTSAETLKSLAAESSKASEWQALKIPHAKVLVQEKDFVLKTWIEGQRGDEVIEKFASGDPSYKAAAEYVLALVAKIRAKGAYVGDFRPANLIWNGKAWIIIDSGSIQQGMTLEEAQTKWAGADDRGPKFERRWKMPLAPVRCVDLFGKAG